MKYYILNALGLIAFFVALAGNISPDAKSGEQINWQVISSGGTEGASTSYRLAGTVGQTAVGSGSSDNFGLSHGYWQSDCCWIRGDVDHSGGPLIDIADLIYLVDYMFNQGPEPECWDEGDINGDGAPLIDISDLIYLVDYMFNQGPAPPPCP